MATLPHLTNLKDGTICCKGLIHAAVEYNRVDLIQHFIEAGHLADQRDEHGWTPLMYAALECKFEKLKGLVETFP